MNQTAMKRWLGAFFLLSIAFAAAIHSFLGLEERSSTNQEPQPESDRCLSVRFAVVTIYAGEEFGAGSIVSAEGLVLTNHHVVQRIGLGPVNIRTLTGDRHQGRVIATDTANDLALIQLETQVSLPTVRLGSSTDIRLGQAVCAIGSPLGRPGILSRGKLLDTEANGDLRSALLLYPGNSGGPLLNQQGEMIGVNKAIWQSNQGENSGISFATNLVTARNFIQQHQTTPSSTSQSMPPIAIAKAESHLGVQIDRQTLVIQKVEPNSPAEAAKLEPGDRIIALENRSISDLETLLEFLSHRPSSALLTVQRHQQLETVRVKF